MWVVQNQQGPRAKTLLLREFYVFENFTSTNLVSSSSMEFNCKDVTMFLVEGGLIGVYLDEFRGIYISVSKGIIDQLDKLY